jgi:fused signal recognition particle receptor
MKIGIVGTVKSLITREVEISEKDVREMVEALELELLEADVDIGVSESIRQELMGKLVGRRVARGGLHSFVSGSIRDTLIGILTNDKDFDIVSRVDKGEKPQKIMFIGINGAGKTTTIAKVAKLLMDNNRKVVFAAADTFRAAAIEQMEAHAGRLNVKMIRREYGSDPTSVAYDAVNYAKAHGIDAVLIDTAGRQDTNISLLNEMKKMRRVINPDICIYIGESIAGNAILEQVSAFNREVGVDAVILSKLDCDPKGGTMLSISKATGVPIIYVGTGQGYGDLERFDPRAIVARIVE